MAASKQEKLFKKKLCTLLGEPTTICGWRPESLKNKKTGNNLEIDVYVGKFRTGFEYQGAVHFKNIRRYMNDSDKSRYNDCIKTDLASSFHNPISIVEVFEQDLYGCFKTNILLRISNTRDFYINHKRRSEALNLEYFRLAIENELYHGIKYGNKTGLRCKITRKIIDLDYSKILEIKQLQKKGGSHVRLDKAT